MPNITRGASMYGLIRYLAGNGKHNEHIEAHLVAGDPAVMAWHDDAQLDAGAALQISKDLDRPRLAFGTRISLPAKSNDGSLARSQHTGKPLRRDAHVWHCSLSLRADEPPLSEEHWAAISEEFVAHMGFAQPSSHQRAAVARILNEPAAGLFHQVGAGKTAEMVISCMQLRRLGMVSKPAVVVPNHMLEQFSREWLQLYPQTRLLAAGSEDLAGPRRRTFVARVATNDWDAVLLTRSAFERLPVPPQVEADYIRRESEQLRAMLLNAKGGEGLTVKRLEKQLLRRQEALQKRLDGKVDPGITFEQTGIDYLVIDEAHDYKNLATQSNIRDAAVDGSNRASDLHLKTEYLRGAHGHRVITMATATPIANSVTEAHVMARYLRPDLSSRPASMTSTAGPRRSARRSPRSRWPPAVAGSTACTPASHAFKTCPRCSRCGTSSLT